MKGNVLRQMTRISWRETVLATAALPLAPAAAWAQADAYLGSGFLAGFLHPISGVDHLLLLVGIGAAASCISAQLLLWALAGAIGGGVFGAMGGTLPAQEFLAALAITAAASRRCGVCPWPGPVACVCCWLSAAACQPWGRSAC